LTTPSTRRIRKPDVNMARIALQSMHRNRSFVHTRFDVDELVPALDSTQSDVYIAEHSYMAEAYLRSRRADSPSRLLVNTVNPESSVWTATRGIVGRFDGPRIRRDELRVARAAYSLGTYDSDEAEDYRRNGVARVHWLDVTLPPAQQTDLAQTPPHLAFLGDRTWAPNEEAFRLLIEWWPLISAGIPDAQLFVIGKRAYNPPPQLPDGMTDLGFVDDLDAVLGQCRALVAPIVTGGGVRVKILDAASRGIPLIGTRAAVGSLAPILGLATYDSRMAFVERCRELLLDRTAAMAEGTRLHSANADRWWSGACQRTVESWLQL
jgi:glycosyltransferase involved in cell wall biosynthesis